MKNVTVESCLGLHYPPKEWPKPGDKTSCFVDVLPYEKIAAVVKDGGNWKWPRMWK